MSAEKFLPLPPTSNPYSSDQGFHEAQGSLQVGALLRLEESFQTVTNTLHLAPGCGQWQVDRRSLKAIFQRHDVNFKPQLTITWLSGGGRLFIS